VFGSFFFLNWDLTGSYFISFDQVCRFGFGRPKSFILCHLFIFSRLNWMRTWIIWKQQRHITEYTFFWGGWGLYSTQQSSIYTGWFCTQLNNHTRTHRYLVGLSVLGWSLGNSPPSPHNRELWTQSWIIIVLILMTTSFPSNTHTITEVSCVWIIFILLKSMDSLSMDYGID